ncbi:alpha/beta fold hydrolase [Kineosporia sp. A_224]|uniref:alpha/beta fold hydrolase n=1 Tax=Kineosporia sp. A_224 TaxID=1962180 RepID=UPI000B4B9CA6|nr:alpha/beta fold hydrolase [Kineosporia sp. A_224]
MHGLAGSVTQTRPFGSGVPGTKVLPHLRGHGGTAVPPGGPGTYADLAAEVEAVRAATGATRALGVSLGAGALLRSLVEAAAAGAPLPYERVVLVLPAALRTPAPDQDPSRGRLLDLADALEARDAVRAAALLRDQQPEAVRRLPAVGLWARRRAAEIVGPVLPPVLRAFAGAAPLADLGAGAEVLAAVRLPVLVLAQEGDDVHPVAAAHGLAAALPEADLVVLPPGGVLWTGRDRLREVLTGFLGTSE